MSNPKARLFFWKWQGKYYQSTYETYVEFCKFRAQVTLSVSVVDKFVKSAIENGTAKDTTIDKEQE